ncbi:ribosome assembly RNA-binding protein YhbY [Basilea psittacipulmonis]|uniref:ribosome assembly RNA-binding protein YhbY n=1 Tax=Basilea psittacipulmonis TaxID=1472345 RepID=UPI00068D9E95|nr:ribosome assembly RNA-binding protein YhbY [Basilea psittacipulmonis]
MPILEIDSKKRSELKATAHSLKPVVLIGDAGLTPSVLKEVDTNLTAHGLIKVRVAGDEREARIEILNEICESLSAAKVALLGKILILYRPKPEKQTSPSKSKKSEQYTPKKLAAVGKKVSDVKRRRQIKGNDDIIQKPKKPRVVTGRISVNKKGASKQNPLGFVARIQKRK